METHLVLTKMGKIQQERLNANIWKYLISVESNNISQNQRLRKTAITNV